MQGGVLRHQGSWIEGGGVKSDIEKLLGVVTEATAKTISIKLGLPQEEVAKELHRLHSQGVVEREKRKGRGNEYTYWLARASVPNDATASNAPEGVGTDPVSPVTQSVPRTDISDIDPLEQKILALATNKPEAKPVATETEQAFGKLAGQMRELLDIFGLPSRITDAISAAQTMREIATATSIERDELRAEVESQRTANARLKQNNAELERRIDELTLGPIGSKSPLFVTVGRYAKPMRHDSLEKAQKRGKALVRGEKESEVLVLEPIGRIVRGTEWRPQ
jgi:hypothetical protein